MAEHNISVTVGKESIQVEPSTLIMNSLDDVRWAGTNASKFTIVFAGATPFERGELAHAVATRAQRPRSHGRFKYAVISDDDPTVQLDPIVVVEEPPTIPKP